MACTIFGIIGFFILGVNLFLISLFALAIYWGDEWEKGTENWK